MLKKIRVWDFPTRVFHWALAICVTGLFATGLTGGNWIAWHERFGFVVLGLVIFRLIWGFAGSETSRFSNFVRSPRVIFHYLRTGESPTLGHNPLGALSVVALLLVLLLQALTGLVVDDDIANKGPLADKVPSAWVALATTVHRLNKWLLGALVITHLLAIAYYALVKKEQLIKPMISGERDVDSGHAAPQLKGNTSAWVLALTIAAAVYWLVNIFPK